MLKKILNDFLEGRTVGGYQSAPLRTFRGTFRFAVMCIALFELLSLCAFLVPSLSSPIFLAVVAVTAYLAATRLDLAVLVALAELFIGSQGGYLVTLGSAQGLDMSLRHGLFVIVVGTWFAELVASTIAGGQRRTDAWAWWRTMRERGLLWPYLAFIGVILYGLARGLTNGNATNLVFFDGIRYFYYGLLPAMVVAFARKGTTQAVAAVLSAAVTTSVIKALAVLFFFSHRVQVVAKTLYVWVRDTRVGEITIQVADYYRVFFQSQVFILVAVFVAALLFAYAASLKSRGARAAAAFVLWSMVSMVLSLSRSFWFGGAVAAVALVALLAWSRAEAKIWLRLVGVGLASIAGAVAVISAVYFFPFPNKAGDFEFGSLLSSRAISFGDAAAKSRWELLKGLKVVIAEHPLIGSGFGKTVTYQTSDPRLLNSIGSSYTTYAFEWGYHDLWVKFGAIGLAVYGWLLWAILWPLARFVVASRGLLRRAELGDDSSSAQFRAVAATGLLFGAIALLATNVFSPYLNHALGIGVLAVIAALGANGGFGMKARE